MDKHIPIGRWMIKDVVMVKETMTILDAALLMARNKVGSLIIGDHKEVQGIFTDWDLVKCIAANIVPATEPIKNWMTSKLNHLDANVSHKEGIALMVEKRTRHAPVMDNGKLVGIVSARDLLKLEYTLLEQTFFETKERLGKAQELLEKESDERIRELIKTNEELEDQAFTDALTGLFNHRYFQERLSEEISRSNRHNYPVSLVFIDVDNFKQYNDTNGHMMGDKVLRQIGGILKYVGKGVDHITARLRKTDIVARYGGEEFVILLPYANSQDGKVMAERVRKTIEEYKFEHTQHQPNKKITVSLGVSAYPDVAKTKAELIDFADQALYEAKDRGKNRVCVFSGPRVTS